MLDLLVGILHLVVFPGGLFALALGLFLKGCDRRVEARLQRRVGPPLIQPSPSNRPDTSSTVARPPSKAIRLSALHKMAPGMGWLPTRGS